jgi:hypothetical protein
MEFIINQIKNFVARTLFYKYFLKRAHLQMNPSLTEEEWREQGCTLPPPYTLKRRVMLEYKQQFNSEVFIETGTFMGDTTFEMSKYFDKLYTVEIDRKLFQTATERFKNLPKIKVFQGDGAEALPIVLSNVPKDEKCMFWLDGHYSGSVTGKGDSNTPILKEIEAVYQHNNNHVILIDDARLFVGKDDYPTLEFLKSYIAILHSSFNFEVKDDIIRITPSN